MAERAVVSVCFIRVGGAMFRLSELAASVAGRKQP
jgi:hypothetical protein